MRTIKLLVVALISLLVVVALTGCQSTEEKVKEFMSLRYASKSIRSAYENSGMQIPPLKFEDLNFRVNDVDVIKIETAKDNKGVKYHFVRAKITYDSSFNLRGKDMKFVAVRWGRFHVEEDGFGEMNVIIAKSKEIFAMGESEKQISENLPDNVRDGEDLLK